MFLQNFALISSFIFGSAQAIADLSFDMVTVICRWQSADLGNMEFRLHESTDPSLPATSRDTRPNASVMQAGLLLSVDSGARGCNFTRITPAHGASTPVCIDPLGSSVFIGRAEYNPLLLRFTVETRTLDLSLRFQRTLDVNRRRRMSTRAHVQIRTWDTQSSGFWDEFSAEADCQEYQYESIGVHN